MDCERILASVLDPAAAPRRRLLVQGPRGSGKTWWIDRAAALAEERGVVVSRITGRSADRDVAFGGLAAVFAPFTEMIARLGDDCTALQRALSYAPDAADPVSVKVAALRALAAIADERPLCVLVDDAHLLDSSTRDVLEFALSRSVADHIAAVLTSPTAMSGFANDVVRLDPLADGEVAAILVARGVAASAAHRCARAAGGNPGVALAMVDGLSEAQRAGRAPVPDLPRLGGELAVELQRRMAALGEECCRALVVAAADEDGELGAVEHALRELGEPGLEALEPAEAAGIVELVGTRLTFSDPWLRHAAYHLLAPASRRAAHRALARAHSEPHQAAARVWHLVGASNGRSDALADALALVAGDAAHRGAAATAARTFERAAEFAHAPELRERMRSLAVGAALDAGDLALAGQLIAEVAATSQELQEAALDVREMVGDHVGPDPGPGGGLAVQRRRRRRSLWSAARRGEHREVLRSCDPSSASPIDVVPLALALRHAGRVRDARDLLDRADVPYAADPAFLADWLAVVRADLEVLAGRTAEHVRFELPGRSSARLRNEGAMVAARARLMNDPALEAAAVIDAWGDDADGPVAEVRGLVRSGVELGDATPLQQAMMLAEREHLPIEAGEARLWLSAVHRTGGTADVSAAVRLALATLHRCGVRGWDTRAASMLSPMEAVVPVRAVDPVLTSLSQSERRVAEAIADGLTNREAAARLFLSVKTVDFHLQQIYRKLGLRSRTELAVRMTGAGPNATSGAR